VCVRFFNRQMEKAASLSKFGRRFLSFADCVAFFLNRSDICSGEVQKKQRVLELTRIHFVCDKAALEIMTR
jgi:hypothetical protein